MASDGSSPYAGPRPYRWDEADRLFGRDRELADLCDLIASYRATLLYAQSGAGKSSLVAKVGARLRGKQLATDTAVLTCRVGTCPEGDVPNVFTWSALTSLTFGDQELAFAERHAPAPASTFTEGLVSALTFHGLIEPRPPSAVEAVPERWTTVRPCALVIDQLEELFTTQPRRWRDRRGFIEQLAVALKALPDLNLLLVIREDYVAQLDPYAPLLPEGLRIRYRLDLLREAEARAAIVGPLRLAQGGITVPASVAESIVNNLRRTKVIEAEGEAAVEIEGEFVEPLHLQLACGNLWRVLQGGRPPGTKGTASASRAEFTFQRDGETLVASTDAVGDLDASLQASYETAVKLAARGGKVREGRLRAVIKRRLITGDQTRGFIDQASLTRQGVSEKAVDELIEARIVRREPRFGSSWVELTHDRLIQPILASNRRAKEVRNGRIAGAVVVIVVVVAFGGGGRFFSRDATASDTKAAEQKGRDTESKTWQTKLRGTTVRNGGVRAAKDAELPLLTATTDMAIPRTLSQSSDELLATIQQQRDDRERQIDQLRRANEDKDGRIRVLEARLPCQGAGKRPKASSELAVADFLVAREITPKVTAPELRPGVFNFQIKLLVPPAKADQVKRVVYTFDDPSFKYRTRTVSDASSSFSIGYQGWGCLTNLGVDVELKSGGHVPLTVDMCALLKGKGW